MMRSRFTGMSPWLPSEDEIIECETPEGLVDLHNDCRLIAIEIPVLPTPRLDLAFTSVKAGRDFRLVFHGVLDLQFTQDPDDHLPHSGDWNPEVDSTFYGLRYDSAHVTNSEGERYASFSVSTIQGDLELIANEIEFRWI
jgi:hypothetical protein